MVVTFRMCEYLKGGPDNGFSAGLLEPSGASVDESFVYGRFEGAPCRCSERSRAELGCSVHALPDGAGIQLRA